MSLLLLVSVLCAQLARARQFLVLDIFDGSDTSGGCSSTTGGQMSLALQVNILLQFYFKHSLTNNKGNLYRSGVVLTRSYLVIPILKASNY